MSFDRLRSWGEWRCEGLWLLLNTDNHVRLFAFRAMVHNHTSGVPGRNG